jgi:hypothetical protein
MTIKISPEELSGFSITTGAVLDAHFIATIMTNDERIANDAEDAHCYFGVRRNGQWWLLPQENAFRSQVTIDHPGRGVLSVSKIGTTRFSSISGGGPEKNIGDAAGQSVQGRTGLSEIRSISGVAYATGWNRAVYRRDAPNVWSCIDESCYAKNTPGLTFQSIHGFSDKELYAVGTGGDLWEFDGQKWLQHDSGTNANLYKVLCAPDGVVYIAGREGTLLRGRHNLWEQVENISQAYEFWGLEYFADRLYLTSNTTRLLEFVDGEIRPVDFGECPIPATAYHLTISHENLYCFGAKDIRRFDGKEWHEELTL